MSGKNTKKSNKSFHEQVAEKLLEQIARGLAPWQRPWKPGGRSMMPTNPTTGKRYRGINAIFLMAQGRTDPRWMTYKQAEAVGAQVRKDETSTYIQYWKFRGEQEKLDAAGLPVRDAAGKVVKQTVTLARPHAFGARVFNAEQIDGLPPEPVEEQTWDAVERAEQILHASGAVIVHGGDVAGYRPALDQIVLPDRCQFDSAEHYYATALHELGHWTGHESRLSRDLSGGFGSQSYAQEELRAEIASMMIGDDLGIGHDPEPHAAYVADWLQIVQEDAKAIFRAAADAEAIRQYVLAFENQQMLDCEQEAA